MKDKVKAGILMELGMLKASNAFYADTAAREPRHELSLHNPVWAYLRPKLAFAYDEKVRPGPLFEVLKSDPGDKVLTKKSKLAVFIGACNSDRFRSFMECKGCVCVIFEPSLDRYLEFINDFEPKDFAKNRVHAFWGELNSFSVPLSMLLESLPFEAGFPLIFIQPELKTAHPEYVQTVIEQMEFMFYRQILYPVEGQQHQKCHPIRNITTGLFYDQQKHMYDNIGLYTKCPNLKEAQNSFDGETAMLIASGPDLDNKLDFIAQNRDKAVLIAVNRALKTLQDNGIEPHFAVVNDTSMAVESTFAALKPFKKTVLAAHCLSHTGTDVFPQKLLFGNVDHNIFGKRPNLRLYGSVISTAFSLARFLGCGKCVFVGAQLCSDNPWSLDYSKTSGIKGNGLERKGQKLPMKYPQLYPVKNLKGDTCYTTLNFRDAALWLLDEIRRTGIRCVNTTHESIIFGKDVSVDENHFLPKGSDVNALHEKVLRAKAPDLDLKEVAEYVRQHIGYWKRVFGVASENEKSIALLLKGENGGMDPGKKERTYADVAALAMNNLSEFDKGNISYLVQRFKGFSYRSFFSDVFLSGDSKVRLRGLHHYFKYVALMAKSFINILEDEAKKLTSKG